MEEWRFSPVILDRGERSVVYSGRIIPRVRSSDSRCAEWVHMRSGMGDEKYGTISCP
jgi:hypothetical protein